MLLTRLFLARMTRTKIKEWGDKLEAEYNEIGEVGQEMFME